MISRSLRERDYVTLVDGKVFFWVPRSLREEGYCFLVLDKEIGVVVVFMVRSLIRRRWGLVSIREEKINWVWSLGGASLSDRVRDNGRYSWRRSTVVGGMLVVNRNAWSPLVLEHFGHCEGLVLGTAQAFHSGYDVVGGRKSCNDSSIDLLSRLKGHVVIFSCDVSRPEDDGTDGSALHGVCLWVGFMELDVLSELVFQIVEIHMWKIVDEVPWGISYVLRCFGAKGIEHYISLGDELPDHESRDAFERHRIGHCSVLVLLSLN